MQIGKRPDGLGEPSNRQVGIHLTVYHLTVGVDLGTVSGDKVHLVANGRKELAQAIGKGAAQLMGIKINNIISFTFVIGSFLAAVGSALYFTNYPSIVPLSGSLPGLRAFVAAVFGGIGSIPGAVVGAFLIGLSETVIKSSNWSVFSDAFTFALLIIILVVKPTGLFGEKSTDKV